MWVIAVQPTFLSGQVKVTVKWNGKSWRSQLGFLRQNGLQAVGGFGPWLSSSCCEKWRLHPSTKRVTARHFRPSKSDQSGQGCKRTLACSCFERCRTDRPLPLQSRFGWFNEPGQKDGRAARRWASWEFSSTFNNMIKAFKEQRTKWWFQFIFDVSPELGQDFAFDKSLIIDWKHLP